MDGRIAADLRGFLRSGGGGPSGEHLLPTPRRGATDATPRDPAGFQTRLRPGPERYDDEDSPVPVVSRVTPCY